MKLSFKKWITPAMIIAIMYLVTAVVNSSQKADVHIEDSSLSNSPVITGDGNDVTYETIPKIRPDSRWLQISLDGFDFTVEGQEIEAIYNVKLVLPNNKYAFIENVPRNPVSVVYTNTGCSEIEVPESFTRPDLVDEDVCWILEATCNEGIQKTINVGPRAISKPEECSKLKAVKAN